MPPLTRPVPSLRIATLLAALALVGGCGNDTQTTADASTTPTPAPATVATPTRTEAEATLGIALLAPDGVVAAAAELAPDELPPDASATAELGDDDLPPTT
jgi:hypothetical protein